MKGSLFLLGFLVLLSACKKDKTNFQATPYALEIPSHFPDMIIPADNPMTQEGVDLGRWLFFEKRLSANDSMSCASCHLAQSSFSDPNKYSTGIDGIAGNAVFLGHPGIDLIHDYGVDILGVSAG
jgi:cytochrome c peroxidase